MSKPIFNVAEVDGVISVIMNGTCATDWLSCQDDFDDLEAHLLAMREQVRTVLKHAQRRRQRRNGGGEEMPAAVAATEDDVVG